MKRPLILASIILSGASAWAQTEKKADPVVTIPAHGTATSTAGTRSTAITSEVLLQRYGQASGEEAKTLLVQYHAEEETLFQQRQAAYVEMQGKSDEEKRRIWNAMIDAQRTSLAEHRTLGARLAAARKAEKEKAAATELTASPTGPGSTPTR